MKFQLKELHLCRKHIRKMKQLIFILILTYITVCANAQVVAGKIVTTEGTPVESATVVIQTTDSTFVDAAYTDSLGHFSITSELTKYRLIVQHLLYETSEQTCSTQSNLVIHLKEKENAFDDFVVKGERPLFKLTGGKISYDMPRLLTGKIVSNIYESLLQLPGVREQDGVLILAGAESVTILLNGQNTSMPMENLITTLKSLPYTQMQSAEIMYSTPPQYHVRGSAINIILKEKKAGKDIQGEINTAYTQKHYTSYLAGGSLLYATPKLAMNLNYAFNRNHEQQGLEVYSRHLYKSTITNIDQFNNGSQKANEQNIRLGLDYKLSKTDELNFTYTSQLITGKESKERSDGTFSNSTTLKENIKPIQMHNLLLNYTTSFGLKTGMEYTRYQDQTNQHFQEYNKEKENNFITNSKQKIDKYRMFADHTHTVGSWNINYGAQYIHATDQSSQLYHSLINQNLSAMNIDSELKEYTANAYIGFQNNFGDKLSLSASLTEEYYKFAGAKEWTLFPALQASYSIAPSNLMQFSFSSNKVYPNYWELHGGKNYLNGYAELHGNPLLRPYNVYSSQLSYILKSKYILTVYYNYNDNYSVQLPYQSSDRLALIYKTLNFDYKQVAGLNLIVPFRISERINSRLTLNGFYDKVKSSHFHDISFKNDNFVGYSRLDNTINISSKPNIKMEISGAYISKNIQGPADISSLWNLDAGIKWSFWSDCAELRLKGSDLLNTWTPNMLMKYDNQNLRMNITPNSRAISLSFTYRLNNFKASKQKVDASRFGTK
jgi:hypothetical protein